MYFILQILYQQSKIGRYSLQVTLRDGKFFSKLWHDSVRYTLKWLFYAKRKEMKERTLLRENACNFHAN